MLKEQKIHFSPLGMHIHTRKLHEDSLLTSKNMYYIHKTERVEIDVCTERCRLIVKVKIN